jgi:hypothetical protein
MIKMGIPILRTTILVILMPVLEKVPTSFKPRQADPLPFFRLPAQCR